MRPVVLGLDLRAAAHYLRGRGFAGPIVRRA